MKKMSFLTVILAATLLAACGTDDSRTLTVVPYPNEAEIKTGTFKVSGAGLHCSAGFDAAAKAVVAEFAQQLSLVTGVESVVDENEAGDGFIFSLDPAMPEEAYTLDVSRKAAVVKASSLRGVNYAVQTIKQMLPVEIYGKTPADGKDWSLQCVEINDEPRFAYRGFMLDDARHFFGVELVKKYIDLMEIHKLNKFHWHLTDDQGWRIEIRKYPELTEKGSIRKETWAGHAYGQDGCYDGTPYGEGCWYTQDQIREIVAYAASKGIDVIPEIDLPGHMVAALATYPELGCTGGPYEVRTIWGVASEVLCAGNEKTFEFLENVLTEVTELFPYEYIHIGGDECPKTSWEKCPKCQSKIRELGLKDEDGFKAEHYLQSYVMERIGAFLAGKGKKVIGWDEILEGKIGKSATIMSWRGTSGGIKAAKLGNDVVMSPNIYCYLDRYQSTDKKNEPLAMGRYVPLHKTYAYDPQAVLTDEEKPRIIGVQGNMWTEYIADTEYLEYMLNPRLAAISEVQWCKLENKDWNRFVAAADDFCGIYDMLGYNYATHVFDVRGTLNVNHEEKCLEMALESHGRIRYTLDGSEPTMESPVYAKPLKINESCVLKARSERDGKLTSRLYMKSFDFHKAMLRPIQLLTKPVDDEKYPNNSPDMLVDGFRSLGGFNNGEYVGWRRARFEAVIEMDGTPYSTVLLSTAFDMREQVIDPMDLVVYTSEDGSDYKEVARVDIPAMVRGEEFGYREHSVSFPETTAKYLKVTAQSSRMPDWNVNKGRAGYLFIDEVIVR